VPCGAIQHVEAACRRAMNARRTIETNHGVVDATVLAELRQGFATSDLVAAIDALDAGEARHKWLRACILRLHAMAAHLVNGAPQTVSGEEPIWQLAEEIGDELDAHAAALSRMTKLINRLGRLRPANHATRGVLSNETKVR
jgi:hypothetical protein